jgi:WXG100 family type VII secretion target
MAGDGSQITYDFGQLTELSAAMGKAHSAILRTRDDVGKGSSNLQANWHGKSGESWGQVQVKWSGACDNLELALMQFAKAVEQTNTDMQAQEVNNSNLFQNI